MKKERGKTRERMPFWMIVIVILLILSLLSSLLELTEPNIFLGFYVSGILGILIQVVMSIVLILLIIGIFMRGFWAWKLALIYFGYALLSGIISPIAAFINPEKFITGTEASDLTGIFFQNFRAMTVVVMVLGFIINLVIFLYFYKHKDFFKK